jgi:CRISPR type III-B/RAMP module RAMP protein Cmr1
MTWTTLELQVTTPLFNGGADPAAMDSGVRVSSVRGAMRFWFRALVGGVSGPDLNLLAKLENTVFGSTEASCPVPLRIPDPPTQRAAGSEQMSRWVVYLLGQGLGDLRTYTTIRPYVRPDETFMVKLRLDHAEENVAALTLASLWLLSAYGGIGARTRRGFGGVRIVGADGPLPQPWTPESIQSPGLEYYERQRFLWPDKTLGACIAPLLKNKVAGARVAWTAPPTFPVLHREYTIAGSGGRVFNGWDRVLGHAGEQLRNFRASRDWPGVPYKPARKTPEWNDVIWGPGDHFPVGALGLPVVFKGRNGLLVNAERDGNSLRRASPLWLRAVGSGDEWRLFSFAFLGEFLPGPEAPAVNLHNGDEPVRRLRVGTADVASLARQWISTMSVDDSFVDLRRQ